MSGLELPQLGKAMQGIFDYSLSGGLRSQDVYPLAVSLTRPLKDAIWWEGVSLTLADCRDAIWTSLGQALR